MGKITLTDAALREAAAAVRQSMLDAIPAEGDCPHEFPPEFEQSLRRQYQQRKGKRKSGHPVLRRVAAIFLATMIALSTWLAVDNRARAAVLRWFREIYENQIVYRFSGQKPFDELPDFELDWVPTGYERTDLFIDELACAVMYAPPGNEAEGAIIYYCLMTEGGSGVVNNVTAPPLSVEINGVKGELYLGTESSPNNVLVWIREDIGIQISITSRIDTEDILHMARSLKLLISTK